MPVWGGIFFRVPDPFGASCVDTSCPSPLRTIKGTDVVVSKCAVRACLMEQYLAAVNAFGKAVRAVGVSDVCQLTQQQKESCHLALQALMDHEREHGCVKRRKKRVRPSPNAADSISRLSPPPSSFVK